MPHISHYFIWGRFLCWTWIFGLVNRRLKCNFAKMNQMKHFHLSKNGIGAMQRSVQRCSVLTALWTLLEKCFKIFWFGKTTVLFLSVDKNCLNKDYHRSEKTKCCSTFICEKRNTFNFSAPLILINLLFGTLILTGPFYLFLFRTNAKFYPWKAWNVSENKNHSIQTL